MRHRESTHTQPDAEPLPLQLGSGHSKHLVGCECRLWAVADGGSYCWMRAGACCLPAAEERFDAESIGLQCGLVEDRCFSTLANPATRRKLHCQIGLCFSELTLAALGLIVSCRPVPHTWLLHPLPPCLVHSD
ncbi:hypothetical protein NDU88_004592 [Pleurodeles waltl]|uniref:Uncharacterized protein n=1 Tax=Pleurodeles waltl TaxID=8319 RepID=A0AAV7SJD6_PLEWA|nr:hypothetical protein NDU88_004592 [Pleurodeles waltl]